MIVAGGIAAEVNDPTEPRVGACQMIRPKGTGSGVSQRGQELTRVPQVMNIGDHEFLMLPQAG